MVLYRKFSSEIKCVVVAVLEMKYEAVGQRGGKKGKKKFLARVCTAGDPEWTGCG